MTYIVKQRGGDDVELILMILAPFALVGVSLGLVRIMVTGNADASS